MKSSRTKHIRKKVSEEFDVTQEQVIDVISSLFKLQVTTMRESDPKSGTYSTLRIPNFGVFYVPDYIVDRNKTDD